MKIQFLGGASRVGSLGMYMVSDSGKTLLFDYGLTPTSPPQYPMEAPPVDMLMLTHAHVDHSGMVPWITSRYNTRVLATEPTITVTKILATDSNKICGIEGYPIPYTKNDIDEMMDYFEAMDFDSVVEMNGLRVKMHRAGHIPGATMYEVYDGRTILFTGDINTIDTHLVRGAEPVDAEILFIESTYAGREHEDRTVMIERFLEDVMEVVAKGGKVLIPAFAVGRTQEILLMLWKQGMNIWIDGMGKTVTNMYSKERPLYVREPSILKSALKSVKVVRSMSGRKRALEEADIIITTSGMLDGGPVMEYLPDIASNPKNAIFLTGYQVEGTNGRMLMDTGFIDIAGVSVRPKAKIGFYDFSAHAGHSQLIDFIRGVDPEVVVLMHGDNRKELAKDLEGDYEVHMPVEEEVFEL